MTEAFLLIMAAAALYFVALFYIAIIDAILMIPAALAEWVWKCIKKRKKSGSTEYFDKEW